MGTMHKYVCIAMSVFVFYFDLTVAVQTNKMFSASGQTMDDIEVKNLIDELKEIERFETSDLDKRQDDDPLCGTWQDEQDGQCVCSTADRSDRCPASDTGGYVCDCDGAPYDSLCDFQFDICEGAIPQTTELRVCDNCVYLKMTGTSLYPETDLKAGLGIFERTEYNGKVEYEMKDDSGYRIMQTTEYGTWHIGVRNSSGEYVMAKPYRAGLDESLLSISKAGFYMLQDSGSEMVWAIDPFLHLECISEQDYKDAVAELESGTQKKFIFFLVSLIVTVVFVAATVALQVAQSIKGCLYYPKVCDYTDEIKNTLKPRVERKQREFKADFGDTAVFRDNMVSIFDSVNDLRGLLVEIRKLYEALRRYTDTSLNGFIGWNDIEVDRDFGSALEEYEAFKEGLGLNVFISLVGFTLTLTITISSIANAIGTVVSTAASVAAGVGAVLAAVAFIVSVFVSREQERKQYEALKKNRRELLDADNQLDAARTKMVQVQKDFCRDLLVPLGKLAVASQKVDQNDPALSVLKNKLDQYNLYIEETAQCNNVYSRIKKGFMNDLKNTLITFLATVTAEKDELVIKVAKAKEIFVYLDALKCDILENSPTPSDIFTFAQNNKPATITSLFANEFDLMKIISDKLFKDRACYWGYNLNDFRSDAATVDNYRKASVIKPCGGTSEMTTFTAGIATDITSNYVPCRMFTNVDRDVVPDMSWMVHYLAVVALPTQRCYWGYDLAAVRNGGNSNIDAELNNAKIHGKVFNTLEFLPPSSTNLVPARNSLQNKFGVANQDQRNFILCVANADWSSFNGGCTEVPNQSQCHVADLTDNTCQMFAA